MKYLSESQASRGARNRIGGSHAGLAVAVGGTFMLMPLAVIAEPIFGDYVQTSGIVSADAIFNGQATPIETSSISGAGTRLNLTGATAASPYYDRIGIGQTTTGSLVVSGGAVVDAGQSSAESCPLDRCNSSVGNGAGSTGTLTVTGAGSRVDLINTLGVGRTTVQPDSDAPSGSFGEPGGTTRGTLNIEDGGTLNANTVIVGIGPFDPPVELQNGNERSIAQVRVDGPGSSLNMMTNTVTGAQARLIVGRGPNSTATLDVLNQGRVLVDGSADTTAAGLFPGLSIATGAGSEGTLRVIGNGETERSFLIIKGNTGSLNVAASNASENGVGALEVSNYGAVTGDSGANDFQSLNVGGGNSTGGTGSVLINSGGVIAIVGNAGPGSPIEGAAPAVNIGRGSGTGSVSVSDGGSLEVVSRSGATTSTIMNIGRDTGSTGSLSIDDANVRVGSLGERSPLVFVGRRGEGTLTVSNGGALSMDNSSGTSSRDNPVGLTIGGGVGEVGGNGTALVTGTGSQILLRPNNAKTSVLTVGRGESSTGVLTVENGGRVSDVTIGVVGIDGATGTVNLDNGTLIMKGTQFVSGVAADTGPALVLGRAGGTGTLNMTNGARLEIEAPSPAVGTPDGLTAVSLGGTAVALMGGTGALNMSGGSSLIMSGGTPGSTANNAQFSGLYVGRIGTGTMSVTGAGTSVDVSGLGNGGRVMVGVEPFAVNTGVGTLTVAEGASVKAGTVLGVAHNGVSSSGGVGTLIVNSGATVEAEQIFVGSQGLIGGDGGVLIGDVVSNFGTISPGLSPGQLTIEGGYTTVGYSKFLLEILSDGLGGFLIDSILFKNILEGDLAFAGSEIEFSFLGDTNPLAFQNSEFDSLSRFFLFDNGSGVQGIDDLVDLDALFGEVSFSARSDSFRIESFTYTPTGGFDSIVLSQVPEPRTLALIALSLVMLGVVRRRRLDGHCR